MKKEERQDFRRGKTRSRFVVLLFISSIIGGGGTSLNAQEPPPIPATIETPQTPEPTEPGGESPKPNAHRFWDKENDWLFAGVGASRSLDYFSTLNMRRRGRQEIFLTNDAVDNHAAFL